MKGGEKVTRGFQVRISPAVGQEREKMEHQKEEINDNNNTRKGKIIDKTKKHKPRISDGRRSGWVRGKEELR